MANPQADLSQSSSNRSSSSSSRKLILAGQIAFLPTGILQTLLGPMLPILIARWALNDTQAGNLFLVQFLVSLVGVQLTGVLLTRWGYRPAFLSGLLLMACGVSTLLLGSSALGMAAVAAYGLGLGLVVPSDNLLIAEIGSSSSAGSGASSEASSPKSSQGSSRASAVSLLNFFWGVGAVFCSLMVAWTAAHHLLPFFLGSVALFLVLLAFAMRNLPFPAAATSSAAPAATPASLSPSASASSHSWRELAKSPAIWIFAAIFFLYPGAETAVGGWIGSYVSRLGSRGAAIASIAPLMPAFFWTALTVGRALGTVFLRHFSERSVLRAGYGAGAAGIGLMLWAPTLTGVIGGALITGLSFATLYPITVARLSQRFGVAARSIGAVMFSLAAVGPAVIPWMVGVISHSTGSLRAGLLLPLGATVILFLVHLFEW
ncbi:MAG TPA: MFS transporter [Candidatus Acidoferrum sp.]|nr:MFS transporter [Candidatus Acidoferrum sp.]